MHARFFYGIVKHLEEEGENDWVTPMLEEFFKGFKSAKAFIAYGPQLTKIVRFALANLLLFLGDQVERIIPNPVQEPQVEPPRNEEPNLEVPNINLSGMGFTEYFQDFSIGSTASGYWGNQEAGEGTSRPQGQGATVPVVTKEVEREERQEEERRVEEETI